MNNIGKNIRQFREEKHLTQEQLAEEMAVVRQAISNWENGKTEPDIDTMRNIANILEISIEELICGERNTNMNWSFIKENNICSFRSAGVLIKDGKLFVQKEIDGDEYALPGGIVNIGETSEYAVIRRYKEETGADIICERLIWVEESFWEWNNRKAHTLTYYYLISLKDENAILDNNQFVSQKCNDNVVVGWMPLDNIHKITIYPTFVKNKINNITDCIEHFTSRE